MTGNLRNILRPTRHQGDGININTTIETFYVNLFQFSKSRCSVHFKTNKSQTHLIESEADIKLSPNNSPGTNNGLLAESDCLAPGNRHKTRPSQPVFKPRSMATEQEKTENIKDLES